MSPFLLPAADRHLSLRNKHDWRRLGRVLHRDNVTWLAFTVWWQPFVTP